MGHWELLFFFLVIAFVYASVGFGGGSSYLAVLAMYELPFQEIRLTALVCNIVVVTGGTFIFIRNKQVNWRRILPLAIVSVPMAYLGAIIKISQNTFFILLGCSLIAAAILLWIRTKALNDNDVVINQNYAKDGLLGGSIGFLSGMVGIGGGIFLAPVLHLLRWDKAKSIAATACVFILVNSISGIAGQMTRLPSDINYVRVALLSASVLIGGQLGSRMGSAKFNPMVIRRLTAMLVFVAGVEVLVRHLQ